MIPKSTSTSSGRTMTNSAIVCPCSLFRCRLVIPAPGWIEVRGALAARRGPPRRWPSCLRQQPRHACDCVRNAAAEPGEKKDGCRADHHQNDGVLGHRLSAIALNQISQLRLQFVECEH